MNLKYFANLNRFFEILKYFKCDNLYYIIYNINQYQTVTLSVFLYFCKIKIRFFEHNNFNRKESY